jgi:hypothetical protein
MMSSPLRRVATLCCLTRALRGEPAGTGDRATGWLPCVGWEEVVALAVELQVAPTLWGVLQAADDPLPPSVADELRHHYRLNTVRNLRFRDQLTQVVRVLNAAGIEPLLIKGALRIVNGTAQRLGDRWMDDLDLVLPAGRMSDSIVALGEVGYRPAPAKPVSRHDLALMLDRAPGWIELHLELGSSPIPALLPAAEVWSQSSPLRFSGVRARAPRPTHEVLHNILHSAVQDLDHAVAGLPLRQLLTLARLVQRYGPELDWKLIRRRMGDQNLTSEYRDHLWMAHRLAGMPLPEDSGAEVSARLHEARAVGSFALRWPAEVHRNLRYALGPDYLDVLYSHGDRPLELARARVRHVLEVLRRDGLGAWQEARERKV